MESALTRPEEALLDLRREMKARGFYQRPLAPILWILAGHVLLALGGLAALIWAPGLAWKIAGLLISCFGCVGLGTVGHTGSHGGAADSSGWNRAIFYISHPLLLQLSATYWRYSHIVIHHPAPNVVGVDEDCDLRPLFALNLKHLDTVSAPQRRWPVLQGIMLPIVLPFNGLNMLRQSWTHVLREAFTGRRRDGDLWLDLGCLSLNVLFFLGIPALFFSPTTVFLVFALRVMIIGMGLFAVLAPGHFPEEAVCLAEDQRNSGDFYLRQGAATVNFRTGRLGRFLCCGLEYQIEHHMFPSISHIHYRAMAPLVEAFCARSGIPYHSMGWGQAIWRSWRTFFHPKPVMADVESLRLPVRPAA